MDEPKPLPTDAEPMEHGRKSNPTIKEYQKIEKTRRGYGRKNRIKNKNGLKNIEFNILSSNANGIQAKKESLLKNINVFQPTVITLQETKLRRLGTFKLPGYQVFEKVRSGFGGGLLTAVNENLFPVLISTGKCDDSEILVVQVKTANHNIRILNAYGPQEDNYKKEKTQEFWQEIEQEVVSGIEDGCLLILQMDANAKLGREIIKNDPHDISENGKLLLDILERQNLTVVNSLDVCDGTITRERKTKSRIEKSVIDYVIVCSKIREFVKSMNIDEDRFHVLTKYASKKA